MEDEYDDFLDVIPSSQANNSASFSVPSSQQISSSYARRRIDTASEILQFKEPESINKIINETLNTTTSSASTSLFVPNTQDVQLNKSHIDKSHDELILYASDDEMIDEQDKMSYVPETQGFVQIMDTQQETQPVYAQSQSLFMEHIVNVSNESVEKELLENEIERVKKTQDSLSENNQKPIAYVDIDDDDTDCEDDVLNETRNSNSNNNNSTDVFEDDDSFMNSINIEKDIKLNENSKTSTNENNLKSSDLIEDDSVDKINKSGEINQVHDDDETQEFLIPGYNTDDDKNDCIPLDNSDENKILNSIDLSDAQIDDAKNIDDNFENDYDMLDDINEADDLMINSNNKKTQLFSTESTSSSNKPVEAGQKNADDVDLNFSSQDDHFFNIQTQCLQKSKDDAATKLSSQDDDCFQIKTQTEKIYESNSSTSSKTESVFNIQTQMFPRLTLTARNPNLSKISLTKNCFSQNDVKSDNQKPSTSKRSRSQEEKITDIKNPENTNEITENVHDVTPLILKEDAEVNENLNISTHDIPLPDTSTDEIFLGNKSNIETEKNINKDDNSPTKLNIPLQVEIPSNNTGDETLPFIKDKNKTNIINTDTPSPSDSSTDDELPTIVSNEEKEDICQLQTQLFPRASLSVQHENSSFKCYGNKKRSFIDSDKSKTSEDGDTKRNSKSSLNLSDLQTQIFPGNKEKSVEEKDEINDEDDDKTLDSPPPKKRSNITLVDMQTQIFPGNNDDNVATDSPPSATKKDSILDMQTQKFVAPNEKSKYKVAGDSMKKSNSDDVFTPPSEIKINISNQPTQLFTRGKLSRSNEDGKNKDGDDNSYEIQTQKLPDQQKLKRKLNFTKNKIKDSENTQTIFSQDTQRFSDSDDDENAVYNKSEIMNKLQKLDHGKIKTAGSLYQQQKLQRQKSDSSSDDDFEEPKNKKQAATTTKPIEWKEISHIDSSIVSISKEKKTLKDASIVSSTPLPSRMKTQNKKTDKIELKKIVENHDQSDGTSGTESPRKSSRARRIPKHFEDTFDSLESSQKGKSKTNLSQTSKNEIVKASTNSKATAKKEIKTKKAVVKEAKENLSNETEEKKPKKIASKVEENKVLPAVVSVADETHATRSRRAVVKKSIVTEKKVVQNKANQKVSVESPKKSVNENASTRSQRNTSRNRTVTAPVTIVNVIKEKKANSKPKLNDSKENQSLKNEETHTTRSKRNTTKPEIEEPNIIHSRRGIKKTETKSEIEKSIEISSKIEVKINANKSDSEIPTTRNKRNQSKKENAKELSAPELIKEPKKDEIKSKAILKKVNVEVNKTEILPSKIKDTKEDISETSRRPKRAPKLSVKLLEAQESLVLSQSPRKQVNESKSNSIEEIPSTRTRKIANKKDNNKTVTKEAQSTKKVLKEIDSKENIDKTPPPLPPKNSTVKLDKKIVESKKVNNLKEQKTEKSKETKKIEKEIKEIHSTRSTRGLRKKPSDEVIDVSLYIKSKRIKIQSNDNFSTKQTKKPVNSQNKKKPSDNSIIEIVDSEDDANDNKAVKANAANAKNFTTPKQISVPRKKPSARVLLKKLSRREMDKKTIEKSPIPLKVTKISPSQSINSLNVTNDTPRSLRHRKIMKIATSKYEADVDVAKLQKLDGEISKDIIEANTLVMGPKADRSFKFLVALARGIPIVDHLWLEESIKSKWFQDSKLYAFESNEMEREFKFSLKASLNRARSKPLLKDHTVIVTPSTKLTSEQYKVLIECSGGSFMKLNELKPSNPKTNYLIITDDNEKDNEICKSILNKLSKLKVFREEQFLLAIVQQKI